MPADPVISMSSRLTWLTQELETPAASGWLFAGKWKTGAVAPEQELGLKVASVEGEFPGIPDYGL